MHTTLLSMPMWSIRVARLAVAVAVTLVIGSMLVPDVGAVKVKAKTSIGVRVEAQLNLCDVQGGTSSVGRNPFGHSTVSCSGGSQGDWKCTNSKNWTSCNPAYTPPPPSPYDGLVAQPPSGVAGGGEETPGSPGGGYAVGPIDIGVTVAAHEGGNHDQDKHDRKRNKRGHGGKDRKR